MFGPRGHRADSSRRDWKEQNADERNPVATRGGDATRVREALLNFPGVEATRSAALTCGPRPHPGISVSHIPSHTAMARLDDLIGQIPDKSLRKKFEGALSDMKRRQRFGLVF